MAPGIRDISYFLILSLDPTMLAGIERNLVDRYAARLAEQGIEVDAERTWDAYRASAADAYISAVVTAGTSDRMQPAEISQVGVDRVVPAMAAARDVRAAGPHRARRTPLRSSRAARSPRLLRAKGILTSMSIIGRFAHAETYVTAGGPQGDAHAWSLGTPLAPPPATSIAGAREHPRGARRRLQQPRLRDGRRFRGRVDDGGGADRGRRQGRRVRRPGASRSAAPAMRPARPIRASPTTPSRSGRCRMPATRSSRAC